MKLQEKYYNKLLTHCNVHAYAQLDHIDFHKPWWHTLWHHKWSWGFILLGTIVWYVFFTLVPILITSAFLPQPSITFGYIMLIWLGAETFKHTTLALYSFTSMIIPLSIQQSVYAQHPRAQLPGAVCAKIERTTQAYKEIFELMVFELLPILTGLITMITSFFVLHTNLGILSFLYLLGIFIISTSLFLLNRYACEPHIVQKDDEAKNAGLEHLLHKNECSHTHTKVTQAHHASLTLSISFWLGFYAINYLTRILWMASIFMIGTFLYNLIEDGTLQAIQATTFLLSYIHNTNKIRQLGRRIEHMAQCIFRIQNLFAYMQQVKTEYYIPAIQENKHDNHELPNTSKESLL